MAVNYYCPSSATENTCSPPQTTGTKKAIKAKTSAVFHIKWRNRKPVTTREQGAARREWWLHFQGLQRRARVVNDFPKGKTSVAICGVAPS